MDEEDEGWVAEDLGEEYSEGNPLQRAEQATDQGGDTKLPLAWVKYTISKILKTSHVSKLSMFWA